jgi:hypothetical protein
MKNLVTFSLSLAALAAPAFGQSVFSFGPSPDYVSGKTGFGGSDPRFESGNQAFNQSGSTSAQTSGNRAFSETVSLTGPAAGRNVGGTPTSGNFQTFSGYTGPAVFGGFKVSTTTNTAGFGNASIGYGSTSATATSGTYFQTGIRNNYSALGGNDALVVNFGTSSTSTGAGSITFQLSFLAGLQLDGEFGFGTGNTLGGTVLRSSSAQVSGDVRMVIKQGDAFFVSDFTKTLLSGANSFSFTSTDFSSGTWSAYNPLTDIDYTISGSALRDLSADITWAGFLFTSVYSRNTTTNGQSAGFFEAGISGISINATPVPEPSTFAALAGFGALGFTALRRRRRDPR